MNDEGLADASAAIPFRLPRNHPGICFVEVGSPSLAPLEPVGRHNLIRLAQTHRSFILSAGQSAWFGSRDNRQRQATGGAVTSEFAMKNAEGERVTH